MAFSPLKDGYYDNQTDNARGGTLSAYFTHKLLSMLSWLYDAIYSPTVGHSHNGYDSYFIGNTIMSIIHQALNANAQYDGTGSTWFQSSARYRNPLGIVKNSSTYQNISSKTPTLKNIWCGQGVNHLRVWINWGFVSEGSSGHLEPDSTASGDVTFKVESSIGSSAERTVTIPSTPTYWHDITYSNRVCVNANALTDLDIYVKGDGDESQSIIIYGIAIIEEMS